MIIIDTSNIISIIRLIIGIIILSYASYTDIKTRKASDILWLIMGLSGLILIIIQYFTIGFENIMYLLFIPAMIGLFYVFFQLRLIFGGADAKALMAIAILAPIEPSILQFPICKGSIMPFSWSIFSNSLVIFLFIPLSLLVINIIRGDFKFPYIFLGYKASIEKAREKFVWPLEKIVDGKRKFVYMPKNFDSDKEYSEFEKNYIKEIWVTPKIPFMIPLLIGFICAFLFGDILFYIISII
jgi:preflagellin peptidase FlaK